MKPPHPFDLQSWVSLSSPSHVSPPFSGAGLSQVLVLVWYPGPHELEHSDHSDHSLHPPSTPASHMCPHLCRYFSSCPHFLASFFFSWLSALVEQPVRDDSNPRAIHESKFFIFVFSFFFENRHFVFLASVSITKRTAMIPANKIKDFITTKLGRLVEK